MANIKPRCSPYTLYVLVRRGLSAYNVQVFDYYGIIKLSRLCDIYIAGKLPRLLNTLALDEDDDASLRFRTLGDYTVAVHIPWRE